METGKEIRSMMEMVELYDAEHYRLDLRDFEAPKFLPVTQGTHDWFKQQIVDSSFSEAEKEEFIKLVEKGPLLFRGVPLKIV